MVFFCLTSHESILLSAHFDCGKGKQLYHFKQGGWGEKAHECMAADHWKSFMHLPFQSLCLLFDQFNPFSLFLLQLSRSFPACPLQLEQTCQWKLFFLYQVSLLFLFWQCYPYVSSGLLLNSFCTSLTSILLYLFSFFCLCFWGLDVCFDSFPFFHTGSCIFAYSDCRAVCLKNQLQLL